MQLEKAAAKFAARSNFTWGSVQIDLRPVVNPAAPPTYPTACFYRSNGEKFPLLWSNYFWS